MPDLTDQKSKDEQISEEIERNCEEIDSFLDANEEEFQKLSQGFINERLAILETSPASPNDLSAFNDGWSGYIHENTEIKAVGYLDGFVLDDKTVYSSLLSTMREAHNSDAWKGKTARDMVGMAIDVSINRYFGNILSTDEVIKNRAFFYSERTTSDSEAFSVAELRGKGVAACMEKAALGNNLFAFLGFESQLVISKHSKLSGEDSPREDFHAFLYVNSGSSKTIIDSTNPIIISDETRRIGTYPSIYKLTSEQQVMFENGQRISVTHNDYKLGENGQRVPVSSTRSYSPK